ncbi:hypothetical protein [Streptacidiphilus carbonis]|uniref:hypothetical protein n=1 Tax=Streptacidiphilus carbonis TaxID=105422 RepID=UPI0005A6128A|nr:hypothetical protein [Streptacidiphilus carbonis]
MERAFRQASMSLSVFAIEQRYLPCSSTSPHLRRARIFDEGGRGLLLVAQMTTGWGTRHTPTGKTIRTEQALN